MLDIIDARDGQDLVIQDSAVMKAANVLSVQLGSLEYASDFGVDIKFFVFSQLSIQMESFKAYLIERLSLFQINVSEVTEVLEKLYGKLTFSVNSAIDNDIDTEITQVFVPALATESGEILTTEGGDPVGV